MKWIATLAALSVAPLCVLAAAAPRAAVDAKALQGTWQAQTQQRGDRTEEPEVTKQHRLVFDGEKFTIYKGDDVKVRGTFKLDAAASPATIDMKIAEGDDDPGAAGKTALGIVELAGDDLKWCSAQPGSDDRPKGFETAGTQNMIVTFHRAPKTPG